METASGEKLQDLADFTDEEGRGLRITVRRDMVTLEADSFMLFPSRFTAGPDEAEQIADLLRARAAQARQW